MPFHLYEPALAEHLIGLACADGAAQVVSEGIGWRVLNELTSDPKRPYPSLVAAALLDPERCPPVKSFRDNLLRDLMRLFQD